MEQCCGITRRGLRCKRHTYSMTQHYGIQIHMCNFHSDQNSIHAWSRKGLQEPTTPLPIQNYLKIFWKLAETLQFMRSIPLVMITTYIYNKDPKYDITDALGLRDEFYEDIFKKCENTEGEECPVCYDSPHNINTTCNHKFCRSCIYQWCDIRGTCPMCREPFKKIF